jgi:putative N-acetyltransferase (TIGR04045 family)
VTVGEPGPSGLAAYRRLREAVFGREQGLFPGPGGDLDAADHHPATRVLVASDDTGRVVGGVRVVPHGGDPTCGWWTGSRLAVAPDARRAETGAALVRAACALVEAAGALRFDAAVQPATRDWFAGLGWEATGTTAAAGRPHVAMRWPIGRVERLVGATKAALGALWADVAPGGTGWVGDDAAPVPGSDLVAACDAVLPSMVERDPEWAGWCAVLVNLNDLAAMGAVPVGILDALGASDEAAATLVVSGLRRAAEAYGVPILGGHTQLGVPAALSVTALGTAARPVPGGGGVPGHAVRLTVDLAGGWRAGHVGTQWDSTTARSPAELRHLLGTVARLSPAAAKDVSMGGIVGTLGMLAEASGCGAELEVAAVPRPPAASLGDWLTCFPGFAMLTTDLPGRPDADAGPAVSAVCGRLVEGAGVTLVWPDGTRTVALGAGVTGLGRAWA